jgi:polysaccharide export outer membrane protein
METEEYRISSQDILDISVYREEDLTREARVAADGKIGFPLIGQAQVAGLTVSEAEERLGRALATYLVHPQVTVQVKEYHARKIYVLGEVKNPGAFQLPSDQTLTVVETIALAGGLTKTAASNRTRVVRQTGGKVENFVVPVADVTKGDKGKDLVLQPGDVVFVPQAIF